MEKISNKNARKRAAWKGHTPRGSLSCGPLKAAVPALYGSVKAPEQQGLEHNRVNETKLNRQDPDTISFDQAAHHVIPKTRAVTIAPVGKELGVELAFIDQALLELDPRGWVLCSK